MASTGATSTEIVEWEGRLRLLAGRLLRVETCFSGEAVVSPREAQDRKLQVEEDEIIPHRLVGRDDVSCSWRSRTTGNPTVRHPSTQAIVVEVDMPPEGQLELSVNGQTYRHSLRELLVGSRGHYLRGWLSEAVRVHRAVPERGYAVNLRLDDEPERETDCYYLRALQTNGQIAWVSPIWVES